MTPHLSALGFTLIHFCWQAALIAGLYKLIEICAPKLRSPERYLIGLVAMVAMLVMAIGTFVYEDIRLASEPTLVAMVAETSHTASRNLTMEALLPWLDGAWLLGVAALSMRMLGGLWFIHRLAAVAEAVPETISRRFAVLMQRAGLKDVRIRLHRHIDGPLVIGALRSVVYLPVSAITALSPDQLDAVLAHELEHVRRADYLWNLVQSLIETLFFFHPAVWWLGSRLREQRELCCDDAAVTMCRDPLTYATALLSLEEQRRAHPRLAMALNGEGSGKTLVSRIARVLGEKTGGSAKGRPPAAYAVPVVLLILAAFAPGAQVAAHDQIERIKQAVTGTTDESAAAVMDDATASAVANSAHTPDIVLLNKHKCPCDKTKKDDEAEMAAAAVDLIWKGDDNQAWRRRDGEWKHVDSDWQKDKDDWKDNAEQWKSASAEWTPDKIRQVEEAARADAAMSDSDRRRIEADVENAKRDALAYAANTARYEDDAMNYARDDRERMRVPEPPEAPKVIAPMPAPVAAPTPATVPTPRALRAPAPAPATPASPARLHAISAAPVPPAAGDAPRAPEAPKAAVSYNYKILSQTNTTVSIKPVQVQSTVKVVIPPDTVAIADAFDASLPASPFVMHINVKSPSHIATARKVANE